MINFCHEHWNVFNDSSKQYSYPLEHVIRFYYETGTGSVRQIQIANKSINQNLHNEYRIYAVIGRSIRKSRGGFPPCNGGFLY